MLIPVYIKLSLIVQDCRGSNSESELAKSENKSDKHRDKSVDKCKSKLLISQDENAVKLNSEN